MGVRTTIFLTDKAKEIIKEYDVPLSKFISEQLEEKFQCLENLKEELKRLDEKKKELLQQKEILENKKPLKINDLMKNNLKDMNKKILEGFDINAIFKRFKVEFKLPDLKRSEFLKLLKDAKAKD